MFIEKKMYDVECDICHSSFNKEDCKDSMQNYDEFWEPCNNKKDLIENMNDLGWIIVGERHYCFECKSKVVKCLKHPTKRKSS